ncbi:helix-turn-helix domain-containing protein [Kitasatospora sp. LaBMicrA B282]|uniref:helix-turn-helix domain-containing protein n=1 Tax=Kitasatospora sp. LaBMicrA B282 TaxID=3420949 RepID=UPI003D10C30E
MEQAARKRSPDGSTGLGRRLRELRLRRGLHQHDLACAHLSVSYVSLIETGKRVPSERVLRRLADRVGCTVDYLRTGWDAARVKELELKLTRGDSALRAGAADEALQAFGEALAEAQLLDPDTARRTRLKQALACEQSGRWATAVELYRALQEDPAIVPGSAEWAQLVVGLCHSHRAAGELALGIEAGERALGQLDRRGTGVTDDHLRVGAALIGCYHDRGDLTRAQLLAGRLTRAGGAGGSRAARGALYWSAALVAESRGDLAEALALTEWALALLAGTDGGRDLGLLRLACADYLLDLGSADLARVRALLAEPAAEPPETDRGGGSAVGTTTGGAAGGTAGTAVRGTVGSPAEQAAEQRVRARLALRLGEPGAAAGHAERALRLLRDEARWESGYALVLLAEAQFGQGRPDLAARTLGTVEQRLVGALADRNTARVRRLAGDLWQRGGYPAEALAAYRRALGEVGLPPLLRPDADATGVRPHGCQ